MSEETRPVLFLTFGWNDPDEANCMDVSNSLRAARREGRLAKRGGFVYRVERLADGTYGNSTFVEELR